MLTVVGVRLEEISDGNRATVLALRVAPGQEQFVSSVPESLAEAAEYPHARPWYRAIVADGTPVGFAMVSWNAEPDPPEIIGPWFLWKLLIDERYQRRGYGAGVVRQIAELVRAEGAAELLTSYVPEPGARPGSTSGSGSCRPVTSTGTARSSCASRCRRRISRLAPTSQGTGATPPPSRA